MSSTTFDSTKQHLLDMLKNIAERKIQLPDFQRAWIWDDERIKGLLASVSLSYPIGAVMLLQYSNEVRFKPRLIEGVQNGTSIQPELLILDGQQRLTALFQALFSKKVVETRNDRGQPIKRWYYIDIKAAVDPDKDREEAIKSLPEDRVIRNFRGESTEDYSTPESEYEKCLFPLHQVADCSEWRHGFNAYWKYDAEKIKLFDQFERQVIKRIEQYQVPLISLPGQTPKDAVCQVFEKVNTGGVALTVFELLTATYAADDFDLRSDWQKRLERLKSYPVLKSIDNVIFLQAVTLLATYNQRFKSQASTTAVSCKRRDILRLSLNDYQEWAEEITKGFEKVAKLLYSQKIFSDKDLPYRTQLVPQLGEPAEPK